MTDEAAEPAQAAAAASAAEAEPDEAPSLLSQVEQPDAPFSEALDHVAESFERVSNGSGPADSIQVSVKTDEDGNGSGFAGLDYDSVSGMGAPVGPGVLSFEPAHTIGITRVTLTGGPPNTTVEVTVNPK